MKWPIIYQLAGYAYFNPKLLLQCEDRNYYLFRSDLNDFFPYSKFPRNEMTFQTIHFSADNYFVKVKLELTSR